MKPGVQALGAGGAPSRMSDKNGCRGVAWDQMWDRQREQLFLVVEGTGLQQYSGQVLSKESMCSWVQLGVTR